MTFNQWTNGPMVQWSNGPMDQWTNGPMDQWSNQPMIQLSNGRMDRTLTQCTIAISRLDGIGMGYIMRKSHNRCIKWFRKLLVDHVIWLSWSSLLFFVPIGNIWWFWMIFGVLFTTLSLNNAKFCFIYVIWSLLWDSFDFFNMRYS